MKTENPMVAITNSQSKQISGYLIRLKEFLKGPSTTFTDSLTNLANQLSNLISHYLPGASLIDETGRKSKLVPYEDFDNVNRSLAKLRDKSSRIGIIFTHELKDLLLDIEETFDEIKNFNALNQTIPNDKLEGFMDQLLTRQNEINAQAKKVLAELEERSSSAEANFERQVKKYIINTQQSLEETVSDHKESLHNFIIDNQNRLNDSIRKTSSEVVLEIQQSQTNAQQSFDEHVNELIGAINRKIDEKISIYDKQKEKMETDFKQKIEAVESLISIVTSGVMADQHIKQANTERNVYWALQVFGFLFMIAAIYSGSVFFSEITNIRLPFLPKPDLVIHVDGAIGSGQNPTTLMFMRLSMIILLTAPAIYLLKEAAVHRHKENLYRQRGIQLATISPYLEELEKEERAAIKKELVASFFQFHDGKADTQNVPDFIRDMREMVGIAKSINGQKKTMRERLGRK
ncbi:hypothetical protein ACH160_002213 [Vibrio alginolyticus]